MARSHVHFGFNTNSFQIGFRSCKMLNKNESTTVVSDTQPIFFKSDVSDTADAATKNYSKIREVSTETMPA